MKKTFDFDLTLCVFILLIGIIIGLFVSNYNPMPYKTSVDKIEYIPRIIEPRIEYIDIFYI